MNIVTLLPFIVLIGAMFLMTRSAKKKQQQAAQMRDQMQPGTGVRTIGGMYATVKEVHDDTVLLEVAPGVHAVYAKNSVGAVLADDEYNRIVHGTDFDGDELKSDSPVVPDDASSLIADDGAAGATEEPRTDLTKPGSAEAAKTEDAETETETEAAGSDADAADAKDTGNVTKNDGDTDAK
ncbi:MULTISPECIES: preprotein translocase subunit YajC [Streptomyces]|uniref:Preprotein translocase subunit YajC n=1 Tax=Streptomyces lycii TaxID=2654337 RepID=A0ABQ7FGQ2_9ACTN|nr:preprotein translocase subunit YajC [Streptomyces lycii]KAF4407549.1 preprotein translocase subunit YajC [Streptomyces lycii]